MISKVNNVGKEYLTKRGAVTALDKISFDINKGDFVAIVGPSGSGKTTLLSVIGCLIHPTSGDVYFNNKKVSEISDKELCHLRSEKIGFIFQFTYLVSHLTVLENVLVPLRVTGNTVTKEDRKRAMEILKRLDMDKKHDFFPKELSGGEIQRTAIARSLINKPSILLADEPTGDLDYKTSVKIFDYFKELNKIEGLTIVVVTHNLDLAKCAHDVYEIIDGKVKELKTN
jgi:ABC-type lipoprotein export system ATPase subunit